MTGRMRAKHRCPRHDPSRRRQGATRCCRSGSVTGYAAVAIRTTEQSARRQSGPWTL